MTKHGQKKEHVPEFPTMWTTIQSTDSRIGFGIGIKGNISTVYYAPHEGDAMTTFYPHRTTGARFILEAINYIVEMEREKP